MKNIVAANWKMHGTPSLANELIQQIGAKLGSLSLEQVQTIICPPYVFLQQVAAQLPQTNMALGAQNVSQYESGAYTGQISASMLKDFGCQYVIIGHSERRAYCGEKDADIAQKCLQAQAHGLIPILCVGETQQEFEQNKTKDVVAKQLNSVLDSNKLKLDRFIVAYEPVWAIGTGLTATPEQAQAVHHLLRGIIAGYDAGLASAVPIIYGGSVKPDNAAGLFAQADINGALVGGASLNADDFVAITQAANQNVS